MSDKTIQVISIPNGDTIHTFNADTHILRENGESFSVCKKIAEVPGLEALDPVFIGSLNRFYIIID